MRYAALRGNINRERSFFMSKVLVNNSIVIDGQFSFDTVYDMKSNPPMVDIRGVFTSSCGYLGEITSLENERYSLAGVNVYQESYGSEDEAIAYYFHATSFGISDAMQEVKQNV
jgi:hypothetical protein